MRRLWAWALLFLSVSLLTVEVSYANEPLPKPVGKVVWVKGTLKAVMPNKEERILQRASIIYEHDELITPADSQAQIIFTDNTLMTFREKTRFYIENYSYHPTTNKKTRSVGKYVMNLLEGGFRTVTGLIAKNNPADYRVNTPVATIGVRGTDYSVYLRDGEIFVGYNEGSPCLTGKGNTLCLSKEVPYGYIPQGAAVPVPLSQRPAVFQEQLEVRPASITPFSAVSGDTGVVETTPRSSSGPITNFCITQ